MVLELVLRRGEHHAFSGYPHGSRRSSMKGIGLDLLMCSQ